MLNQLLCGALISLANFGIHAVMTGLIIVVTRHVAGKTDDLHVFMRVTALLTVTVIALTVAHVSEISVWALFMMLAGITIPNVETFEFAFLIGWSVAVIFEVMRMAVVQITIKRGSR